MHLNEITLHVCRWSVNEWHKFVGIFCDKGWDVHFQVIVQGTSNVLSMLTMSATRFSIARCVHRCQTLYRRLRIAFSLESLHPHGTRAQGRCKESMPLLEKALAIMKETLEEHHGDTVRTNNFLMYLRKAQVRRRESFKKGAP